MKVVKKYLKIWDFDGTLVFSPSEQTLIQGVPARKHYDNWLVSQDMPKRKWSGWWGRKETLMPPIFGSVDGEPPLEFLNQDLFEVYKEHRDNPEVLNVLMTGRHTGMKHPAGGHVCRVILDAYGIEMDHYHYNTGGDTLAFKCKVADQVIDDYPTIEDVEFFEDRPGHVSKFYEWIALRKKEGHIKNGHVTQIYPPEASFGSVGGED